MRYMLMIMSDERAEAGVLPDAALLAAMGRFNDEMVQAGVLLAAEGLHASSRGARVTYARGQRSVIDGPFTETKELLAGFWLIEVASKEEAIAWALRCPFEAGEASAPSDGVARIEIRQIFDAADLPPELLAQVPEVAEAERAFRARERQ